MSAALWVGLGTFVGSALGTYIGTRMAQRRQRQMMRKVFFSSVNSAYGKAAMDVNSPYPSELSKLWKAE